MLETSNRPLNLMSGHDQIDDYEEEESKEKVTPLTNFVSKKYENSTVLFQGSRLNTEGAIENSMADEDLTISYASARTSELSFTEGQKYSSVSIKTNLPSLKINVPLSLTHQDIFDVFSVVSGKEKFQIIEMEQTIATAVKKEPFSLLKMLENCLPVKNS